MLNKNEGSSDDSGPVHYFHAANVQEAIELISNLYDPKDQAVAGRRPNASARHFLARNRLEKEGYGAYVFEAGRQVFQIGACGKIWAMLCLLPLSSRTQKNAGRTPRAFAAAILDQPRESRDCGCLAILLKTTATNFSDDDYGPLSIDKAKLNVLFENVVKYAARILENETVFKESGAAEAKLLGVLEGAFNSPEHCANAIYESFQLSSAERGPSAVRLLAEAQHYFEPSIEDFMQVSSFTPDRDNDEQINASIQKIMDVFRHEKKPTRPQIAVLEGHEQSGKKSIIGDFLRQLKSEGGEDKPVQYRIMVGKNVAKILSLFVVSLPNHDYPSLAALVLAYLNRKSGEGGDKTLSLEDYAQDLRRQFAKGDSPDGLIQQIELRHKEHDVLFIFLDAHGLDRDSLQRVLRRAGLYRLLVRLWKSNRQSRYLITTAQMDRTNVPKELKLDGPTIDVPFPSFDRFAWCLPDIDRDRFRYRGDSERSLEDCLRDSSRQAGQPIPVTGDALIALSVLYTLRLDAAKFVSLAQNYLAERAQGGMNSGNAAGPIYRALVEVLDEQAVLLPVALIAATRVTEDVLTDSSLEVLVSRYYAQLKIPDDPVGRFNMRQTLERLRSAARKLFLAQIRPTSSDIEEHGFFESSSDSPMWHMSTAIARSILEAMLSYGDKPQYAELARHALRLVATAARRRAQWKRVRRSDSASAEDRQDTARDIQAYVALLGSLPPRKTRDANEGNRILHSEKSLYRSVDKVFTIRPDRFEAETAYRFAVLCLLRQHIDHNHQLSMVTDQDELRLKLYLLAFLEVGCLHKLSIARLREEKNPANMLGGSKVDERVVDALGPKICLELLLSVALAAYHSQLPEVVVWAWKAAESLAGDHGGGNDRWEIVIRSRLACTVADTGLLCGREVVKDESQLASVLHWIQARKGPIVAELGFDPIDSAANDEKFETLSLGLIKARMRIAAREADLSWIALNDRQAANRIYLRLEQLENRLAEGSQQGFPIVLSGRTARRYARFQGDDYPLLATPWFGQDINTRFSEDVRRNVLFVIQTNINRLNEYAGADRIGIYLDQARRHCLRHDFAKARRFIDEAEKRLDFSRISHGGKMEVFLVKAGVALVAAETAAVRGDLLAIELDDARKATNELVAIADDLKLLPAIASGAFLVARLNILENFKHEAAVLDEKVVASLQDASRIAKATGYKALSDCIQSWKDFAQTHAGISPL